MPVEIGKHFSFVQRETRETMICKVIENDIESRTLKMQVLGSNIIFKCHISELGQKYKPYYGKVACQDKDESSNDINVSIDYAYAQKVLESIIHSFDWNSIALNNDELRIDRKAIEDSLSLAITALEHMAETNVELIPFSITDEQIGKIEISNSPISLNRLVNNINETIDHTIMRPISVQKVTKWLIRYGFLEEKLIDGKPYKVPTEDGNAYGIIVDRRETTQGKIRIATLYKSEAQTFIVKSINDISRGKSFP